MTTKSDNSWQAAARRKQATGEITALVETLFANASVYSLYNKFNEGTKYGQFLVIVDREARKEIIADDFLALPYEYADIYFIEKQTLDLHIYPTPFLYHIKKRTNNVSLTSRDIEPGLAFYADNLTNIATLLSGPGYDSTGFWQLEIVNNAVEFLCLDIEDKFGMDYKKSSIELLSYLYYCQSCQVSFSEFIDHLSDYNKSIFQLYKDILEPAQDKKRLLKGVNAFANSTVKLIRNSLAV